MCWNPHRPTVRLVSLLQLGPDGALVLRGEDTYLTLWKFAGALVHRDTNAMRAQAYKLRSSKQPVGGFRPREVQAEEMSGVPIQYREFQKRKKKARRKKQAPALTDLDRVQALRLALVAGNPDSGGDNSGSDSDSSPLTTPPPTPPTTPVLSPPSTPPPPARTPSVCAPSSEEEGSIPGCPTPIGSLGGSPAPSNPDNDPTDLGDLEEE